MSKRRSARLDSIPKVDYSEHKEDTEIALLGLNEFKDFLEIKDTENKGVGLFAKQKLDRGTVIPVYGKELSPDSVPCKKTSKKTDVSYEQEEDTKDNFDSHAILIPNTCEQFGCLCGCKDIIIKEGSTWVVPNNKLDIQLIEAAFCINEPDSNETANCQLHRGFAIVCTEIEPRTELTMHYGDNYQCKRNYKVGKPSNNTFECLLPSDALQICQVLRTFYRHKKKTKTTE